MKGLPLRYIVIPQVFIGFEQARSHLLTRFRPDASEPDHDHELAAAPCQIDLSGQCDVPVFSAGIVPRHLEMLRKILPAIGVSDETHGHFLPGHRAGKRQSTVVALRKHHGYALIIANPSSVTVAPIGKVWRKQSINTIVRESASKRDEAN